MSIFKSIDIVSLGDDEDDDSSSVDLEFGIMECLKGEFPVTPV